MEQNHSNQRQPAPLEDPSLRDAILRALLSGGTAGVVAASKASILWASEPLGRLLHIPLKDLLAAPPRVLFRSSEEFEPGWAQLQEGSTDIHPVPVNLVFRRGDGEAVPVQVRPYPASGGGDGEGLVLIVTDRAGRRDMEAALRESEGKYRRLVDTMIEGLGIVDPSETITFANDAFARIFGVDSADQIVGRNLSDFTKPDQFSQFENRTGQRRQGHADAYEATIVRPDGEERRITISARPIIAADGRFVGTQGLVTDVTELRRQEDEHDRLEAQVRQMQKMESLGDLAGGIAHDFNNFLMAVMGNADLALARIDDEHGACQYLHRVLTAAKRAGELCEQMLAYSGKSRVEPEPFDLSEIVREIARVLEVSVTKRATLRLDLAKNLKPVMGDRTQLNQVVLNLVTNAADSLDQEGGLIHVKTDERDCDRAYLDAAELGHDLAAGTYVAIEVSDTGEGMTPETRKRLFDPFFTTKPKGRGLGLSTVLGIVRGHGGAIHIRSAVGEGTTFTILLPPKPGDPAEGTSQEVRRGALQSERFRGRTALVIDDEPSVRDVTERMLIHLGFSVLEAADGLEGLDVFRRNMDTVDLVVLDQIMPRLDGIETLRELRAIRPDLPVLMISGFSERELPDACGTGQTRFLQKPFRAFELQSDLESLLPFDR